MSQKQIYYSDKYDDEKFEYRHVMLPKDIAKRVPKTHLMSETEWRNLGVQQSQGWIHYMIHQPEPVQVRELHALIIVGETLSYRREGHWCRPASKSCFLTVACSSHRSALLPFIKSNRILLVTYTWLADVNASVAKCVCF
uniref:Cyclin-dependent kinases regulatory subunit n=1 Tax=Hucho hucho TaxID=62062 RepID=A0A4W5MV86_9TELE